MYPTVHFSGVKLHVDSMALSVVVARGDNATIPCRFWYEPELNTPRQVRVKWTWQAAARGLEAEVLVAAGSRTRSSEEFGWVRTCVSASFSKCELTVLCAVRGSGDACISDGISQETLRS